MVSKEKTDLDKVNVLIGQGESISLEFKTSTAKLHSIFETICAFLNGSGGTVLIGVKNNGEITGQDVTDNTRLEIANLLSKLEPPTSLDIEYIPIDKNKYIIKIDGVSNRSLIPFVFDGKPYWRVESSTKLMPQQRYHQLLVERTHKTDGWELTSAEHYTIDDLDKDAIINAVNTGITKGRMDPSLATDDPTEALLRFKLLVNGTNISKAAVVLFCRDPMPYYPQCLLRMAKFKGSDKSDLLDSKRVYGNAFVLLREAEYFLMRNISIESEFIPGKMERKDIPDYPPRAVREAMVNAIAHRDYSIQGGSISLMIYSDELEISSHGTLPFGITVDDLKKRHESLPRNERITNVMNKTGNIESVGTGTQEMIKECKQLGKPEPEYIERGNTFVVCFKKSILTLKDNVDIRQNKILSLLKQQNGLSSAELKKRLDVTISERTIRRDLNHLMELGRLRLEGKGASAIWFLVDEDMD